MLLSSVCVWRVSRTVLPNGLGSAWILAAMSLSCLWNITSGAQEMCIFSVCSPGVPLLVCVHMGLGSMTFSGSLSVQWLLSPGFTECGCWLAVLCALVCTRDSPVPRRPEKNLLQRPPNCTREKEISLQERRGVAAKSKLRKECLAAGCSLDGSCFLTASSVQCDAAAQFIHSLRLSLDGSLFLFHFLGTGI